MSWNVASLVRQFEKDIDTGRVAPDAIVMLIRGQNARGIKPVLHQMGFALYIYLIKSGVEFTIQQEQNGIT